MDSLITSLVEENIVTKRYKNEMQFLSKFVSDVSSVIDVKSDEHCIFLCFIHLFRTKNIFDELLYVLTDHFDVSRCNPYAVLMYCIRKTIYEKGYDLINKKKHKMILRILNFSLLEEKQIYDESHEEQFKKLLQTIISKMIRKHHDLDDYAKSKKGTYTVEDNLMVARLLACTFQVEFVYHALLKENKCDCVVSYSVKTDGCSKHQHHKKMPLNLYSYREYPQILTYGRKKKKTDKYTTQHCNFAMIQTNTMQNCGLSFGAIKKSLSDEILWRISTYMGPYSVWDFTLLCTMVDIDVEINPCNALTELLLKDDRMNQRKLYEGKKDLFIYNSKK